VLDRVGLSAGLDQNPLAFAGSIHHHPVAQVSIQGFFDSRCIPSLPFSAALVDGAQPLAVASMALGHFAVRMRTTDHRVVVRSFHAS
jgi:hypothetical protein